MKYICILIQAVCITSMILLCEEIMKYGEQGNLAGVIAYIFMNLFAMLIWVLFSMAENYFTGENGDER